MMQVSSVTPSPIETESAKRSIRNLLSSEESAILESIKNSISKERFQNNIGVSSSDVSGKGTRLDIKI